MRALGMPDADADRGAAVHGPVGRGCADRGRRLRSRPERRRIGAHRRTGAADDSGGRLLRAGVAARRAGEHGGLLRSWCIKAHATDCYPLVVIDVPCPVPNKAGGAFGNQKTFQFVTVGKSLKLQYSQEGRIV